MTTEMLNSSVKSLFIQAKSFHVVYLTQFINFLLETHITIFIYNLMGYL